MNRKDFGTQIVIVDNGFVYIGQCFAGDGFLTIASAKNIRVWGTSKGLSELRDGPTKNTVADECGTVLVPFGRVILFIEVQKGW